MENTNDPITGPAAPVADVYRAEEQPGREAVVGSKYLVPFVIVTSLFALWGFANDITNPMVAAFQTVLEISNFKASLIQLAFYGGYFTMAIPAALFIRKYSYKSGILLGLGLYATGAMLFYPAAKYEMFGFFLASLYILTFGLAFLETTANPYILSMGSEKTATRRLNLAQAFNPIGSLMGMFVAQQFILSRLQSDRVNSQGELIYTTLDAVEKAAVRTSDLMVIRNPYLMLGLMVVVMMAIIGFYRMPKRKEPTSASSSAMASFRRLIKIRHYREGVLAQAFYVGAQIMCWTFIIQYAENLGMAKAEAQNYNIIAMVIFLCSRFVSTFLLKYVRPGVLLMYFAFGGLVLSLGAVFLPGITGLYCLVGVSAFMSLMFPTIYGMALNGLDDEDAKLGAAGLVMAIVGGALMPPLQGAIIDLGTVLAMPAVKFSFLLPAICFVAISLYGYRASRAL
ncbi:L-fucose:H+ symporter permease [Pontibacter sp. E15-1]|uniref:L-fucose:H+ symporter permease n=1 Tax=Pontibacter sp. E15-1 TaxID=2919918 RepID=UPI001F4FF333|nr:L-fucose:H+ symporter permease [Pontibacter sp. E15-1]MCJ8164329.1 L-fucose:H+ symporter permease [Pontibacter sp. E15-1]